MKTPYTSPVVTKWGSVTELTLGQGKSKFTDDFICVVAEGTPGEQTFSGSTGKCAGTEEPLG